MRLGSSFVLAIALFTAACQDCPDGGSQDSVYCHGAQASDCAADEHVCGGVCTNTDTDRDNCGSCGTACGDGLVCFFGECVAGCDNGLARCGDECVDLASDEANCGACSGGPDATCRVDQTCINGDCSCGPDEITCSNVCTNPKTNNMHCGATTDCAGTNAGVMCSSNQTCVAGTCTSTLIYRGSLVPTTGRWAYNGVLGLTGADAACNANWPGSKGCSYTKLMAASMKVPSELVNAVDTNGTAVTSWWVDDPNVGEGRCTSNADNAPWTYQTADQGHVGKFADLTPATGALGAFTMGTLPSCNQTRNVACCSIVTAP
jgi:hypothetical protein